MRIQVALYHYIMHKTTDIIQKGTRWGLKKSVLYNFTKTFKEFCVSSSAAGSATIRYRHYICAKI